MRDLEQERSRKLGALKVLLVGSGATINDALARGVSRLQSLDDLYVARRTGAHQAKEAAIASARTLEELDAIEVR